MTTTHDQTTGSGAPKRTRLRVPAQRQEELLDEFERSGLSAMQFTKGAGINYATFANWRKKRRLSEAQIAEAKPAVEAADRETSIEASGDGGPSGEGHRGRGFGGWQSAPFHSNHARADAPRQPVSDRRRTHQPGGGPGGPVRFFETFAEACDDAPGDPGTLTVEFFAGAQMAVESPPQLRLAAELLALMDTNARAAAATC